MTTTNDTVIAHDLDFLVLQLDAAVQAGEDAKWQMGDVLVEIDRLPEPPSMKDLEAKLGGKVGTATLYRYRECAAAWPKETRVDNVSWSVHRELVGCENRTEILAGLIEKADGANVTVKAAKAAVADAPSVETVDLVEDENEDEVAAPTKTLSLQQALSAIDSAFHAACDAGYGSAAVEMCRLLIKTAPVEEKSEDEVWEEPCYVAPYCDVCGSEEYIFDGKCLSHRD